MTPPLLLIPIKHQASHKWIILTCWELEAGSSDSSTEKQTGLKIAFWVLAEAYDAHSRFYPCIQNRSSSLSGRWMYWVGISTTNSRFRVDRSMRRIDARWSTSLCSSIDLWQNEITKSKKNMAYTISRDRDVLYATSISLLLAGCFASRDMSVL